MSKRSSDPASTERCPIVCTPGEPAGIGPDLLLQTAALSRLSGVVAVSDPQLLRARASELNLQVDLIEWSGSEARCEQGQLYYLPTRVAAADLNAGQLNPANAAHVLSSLEDAMSGCLSQRFSGLLTGPVNKASINEAGIAFSGHTEFLRDGSDCERVVMLLSCKGLRVALVTTHLPLREVADAITADAVLETLLILHDALITDWNLNRPRILVCGLNPHAGESGHLGREEIEIIEPALSRARSQGMDVIGPLPADTLFTPRQLQGADAVLAMYHDQGLPVLKYAGFGNAANITLGLPFVRCSVDHGTALDLAGTGRADAGSFRYALEECRRLAHRRLTNRVCTADH